jgi:hypothetical protein
MNVINCESCPYLACKLSLVSATPSWRTQLFMRGSIQPNQSWQLDVWIDSRFLSRRSKKAKHIGRSRTHTQHIRAVKRERVKLTQYCALKEYMGHLEVRFHSIYPSHHKAGRGAQRWSSTCIRKVTMPKYVKGTRGMICGFQNSPGHDCARRYAEEAPRHYWSFRSSVCRRKTPSNTLDPKAALLSDGEKNSNNHFGIQIRLEIPQSVTWKPYHGLQQE